MMKFVQMTIDCLVVNKAMEQSIQVQVSANCMEGQDMIAVELQAGNIVDLDCIDIVVIVHHTRRFQPPVRDKFRPATGMLSVADRKSPISKSLLKKTEKNSNKKYEDMMQPVKVSADVDNSDFSTTSDYERLRCVFF